MKTRRLNIGALCRSSAPLLVAVLMTGCGQVSDMLGLQSKPKPAPAPVEQPMPAPAPVETATASAREQTAPASRPARPRASRKPAASTQQAAIDGERVVAVSPETAASLRDAEEARNLDSHAAAAPPPVSGPPFLHAPRTLAEERRIYSKDDSDVVPARLLSKPTSSASIRGTEAGINTMELIVSKQGRVEEVKLVSPAARMTDMLMLSGAKTWKFVPATRNGEPVRYRTLYSWESTK